MPRSLKLPVGFAPSNLRKSSTPSRSESVRRAQERRRPLAERDDRRRVADGQAVAIALDQRGHAALLSRPAQARSRLTPSRARRRRGRRRRAGRDGAPAHLGQLRRSRRARRRRRSAASRAGRRAARRRRPTGTWISRATETSCAASRRRRARARRAGRRPRGGGRTASAARPAGAARACASRRRSGGSRCRRADDADHVRDDGGRGLDPAGARAFERDLADRVALEHDRVERALDRRERVVPVDERRADAHVELCRPRASPRRRAGRPSRARAPGGDVEPA